MTMLVDPMLDPMGALITEARGDADLSALVGSRVRGGEPGPDDARGPGEYQAFVVLSALSLPPHLSLPITFGEIAVRCYGTTYQNASAVWGAFVKAFHKARSRVKSNGLGIYSTFVLEGGTHDADPQTRQPVVTGTIRVIATALAVETAGS